MKNKILLFIVFVLSIVEVISLKYHNQTNFSLPKKEKILTINVKDAKTNTVSEEELESYIVGVVGAEMPASFDEEALKAQAVAARTYALYKIKHSNKDYDVVADVSNQAYQTVEELKAKWGSDFDYYYNRIKDAVNNTKREIMTYNDEVIIAYYFAMSNGYTEDGSLVFNEQKPYLKSTDSIWEDSSLRNFVFKKEYTIDDFCQILGVDKPIKITDIKRSSSNRVISLKINNQPFSGIDLRKKLNLRSTDMNFDLSNDKVVITTKGYGHGVGLSQYGANIMAKSGYNYKQILKHYYSGIELSKI